MKKNRKAGPDETKTTPPIHLELLEPGAHDVYIAGSFNEWQPQATPMVSLGNGKWVKELTLPTGRYEYRFVVDGQWRDDARCDVRSPNPFGGENCICEVAA